MTTQTINLDILNAKPSEAILARYGETGRTIKIHAYNSSTGDDINLGDMTSVKLQMYKPDGNFIIKTPTISEGDAVVTFDEQMTASYGTGFIDLKLTDSAGVVYTCHASVVIDTPVSSDDVIESLSLVDGYIFPDDFQLKLTAGDAIYFTGEDNRTINARATALSPGYGIDISGNEISVDEDITNAINGKQNTLTAGNGITITNDTISASVEGLKSFIASGTSNQYGTFRVDNLSTTPSDFVSTNMISVQVITPNYCFATIEYGSGYHYCQLFDGNPYTKANEPFEARVWYVPISTDNLTAEEHRVGEED